jgi:nitrogenase subunit NifH
MKIWKKKIIEEGKMRKLHFAIIAALILCVFSSAHAVGLTCPHCGKQINLFKQGGGEKAAKELGIPFLGKIPIDPKIVELGDDGKAFITYDMKSKASEAFNQIVEKVVQNSNKEHK